MKILTTLALSIVTALSSCATEEDKTETPAGTSVGSGGVSANSATSLSAMKLSSSLDFNLPSAFESSPTSLALAAGARSQESCELGQNVKEGIHLLKDAVGTLLCHLEVESDQILFGKKYNLTIKEDGGEENLGVWIDNSGDSSIKIYFCSEQKLQQIIEIEAIGRDVDGAKGSLVIAGDDEEESGSFAVDVKFDVNVTEVGKASLSSGMKYTSENGNEFRRIMTLELSEDGVSRLQFSADGNMGEGRFTHRGVGKADSEFGQAVFSSSIVSQAFTQDFTRRAYFNSDGVVVASDASDRFAEGGALHIAASEVPAVMPEDFSPAALPEDAWDCVGEEDLILDIAGDKGELHDACEQEDNNSESSCQGDDHEASSEQIELEGDGKKIEDLSEIAD